MTEGAVVLRAVLVVRWPTGAGAAEDSGDGVMEKFLVVALRRYGNMKVKMVPMRMRTII